MDVGDPFCGLAGKSRHEEELALPVLRVEEVLDTEKRFEGLVAVAGGPVEERVPARGLGAGGVGGPIAEVPHLQARGEPPRQPRGQIPPRGPERRERDRAPGLQVTLHERRAHELGVCRVGEIPGDREPIPEVHRAPKFDTSPVGGPGRLRRPGVAVEHELALEVQDPVGREELRPGEHPRLDAELITLGRRQRRELRVREDRACVVAVEPCPVVRKELGLMPGPEDQVGLLTQVLPRDVAGQISRRRVDMLGSVVVEDVCAHASDEPDLLDRHDVQLDERRGRLFDDVDVLNDPRLMALGRGRQDDVRGVDAVLKPDRRVHVDTEGLCLGLILRIEPGEHASVALVDLVANQETRIV